MSNFKVFYTDSVNGRFAPALRVNAMPISVATEVEAFKVAEIALKHGKIVWKIERPDGTTTTREEIEFIYRVTLAER